jgi:medium-chain acyl-[acyl-carrier-protein] hydrolase
VPAGSKWLTKIRGASGVPRTRLLCFSYAGGSTDLFRAWSDDLAPNVELLAVQLPGHGSRLREQPYPDWESLLKAAFTGLSPYLALPHAFYGHSFGGRLAYELTHLVEAEYPGRTQWLFVSGCRSPDSPQAEPYLHERSGPEFRAALRELGGTPPEILESDAMMKVFLPAIHGEIRLAEIWADRHGRGVDAPMAVMYGRDDPVDSWASVRGWPRFSRRSCELIEIPGGHFFLETHRRDLIEIINNRLAGSDG